LLQVPAKAVVIILPKQIIQYFPQAAELIIG
jgi:hypothetical protein